MTVVTPKHMEAFLRSYFDTLNGTDLFELKRELCSAKGIEDLNEDLKKNLHLQEYVLSRNIVDIIRTEFERLIPDRCLQGKLFDKEQTKGIGQRVALRKKDALERFKQGNYAEEEAESTEMPLKTALVTDFSNHVVNCILKSWQQEVKISTKLEESGRILLYVEQPVMLLSKCADLVSKWISVLQSNLSWIHFVAKEAFYVDCSLEKEKWHGTNILIVSNKMESLPGEHIWDLSGNADRQNGGHVMAVCGEFSNMGNLKIITNGFKVDLAAYKRSWEEEVQTMQSRFPPWTYSDSLRKLAFENAAKLKGTTTFLWEPTESYNRETGEISGPIYDFYMEGQTESGIKYHYGFTKGWTARTAIFLLQATSKCNDALEQRARPGLVTFVSPNSRYKKVSLEELGVQVVAEKESKEDCEAAELHDVGYVQNGTKDIVHYPPGKYEVKLSEKAEKDSFESKLKGKFLTIEAIAPAEVNATDEKASLSSDRATSGLIDNHGIPFNEALDLFSLYLGRSASGEDEEVGQVMLTQQAQWWTKKIGEAEEKNQNMLE